MRVATIAIVTVYALVCTLLIRISSEGDYEWMVGQKQPDDEILTLCTIPASTDDTSDMAKPLLAMIILLFVPGMVRLIRQRPIGPSLVFSLGILIFWVYSFFVRKALFC
jgi:hypothetical protein